MHAISRFPLLQDKIKTDCALTIIKAKAQGNVLGEDFDNWNGSAPEWTPFGCVIDILGRNSVTLPAAIHPQIKIKSIILEQMTKCKFHLSDKQSALELHKSGNLLPMSPDIAIWTDGSLNRQQEFMEEVDSGAAAIVKITSPSDSAEYHDTIQSQIRIKNATSSYETEMIAIQAGLDVMKDEYPTGRKIHLFTDSLSCLQQLACLPYRVKYVHEIVADVAESLAELVQANEVELHFIPSHTGNIPESDVIDLLAKAAATDGIEIDHDPFISTFRLEFRKLERRLLETYLWKNIKQSGFPEYPDRIPLRNGYITIKSGINNIRWPLSSSNALLNRVRTGHTCARAHLANVKIESDDKCRHCEAASETVKHQLLDCPKLETHLGRYRRKYQALEIRDFNWAVYDLNSTFMAKFLKTGKKHGCYI